MARMNIKVMKEPTFHGQHPRKDLYYTANKCRGSPFAEYKTQNKHDQEINGERFMTCDS